MSPLPEDRDFIAGIKKNLDDSTERLDAGVRSRLTQARHHALDQKKGVPSWFGDWSWKTVSGVAAMTAVLLALVLALNGPATNQAGSDLEDLDLLANADQLELYEDLEFYAWLAEEESTDEYETG